MSEVIQFNCPSCGTMLRLPLAMAARVGPCPNCQHEIVAPDPHRGTGARVAEPVVLKVEPEPFRPFAESPPLVPKSSERAERLVIVEPVTQPPPEPEVAPPEPVQPPIALPPATCNVSQNAVLVLSCLLAGAVGLAMGFALGVRSTRYFESSPAESAPFVVTAKREVPPAVEPAPVVEPPPVPVVEKPVPKPPKAESPDPPVKASAAAEASLRAFLEAPDWATRCAHVLNPESVRTAMEAYSHDVPDGPTAYKSISVKQSQLDETSGSTLFVFIVTTEKFPKGIPLAVKETASGWLVDWLTFVEFRDGLFQAFADGPANKSGFFHLIVRTPPPDEIPKARNENFASYLLQSPLADEARLAYVSRKSTSAAILEAQTADSRNYAPVLEVVKRKTPDKKDFLEIISVKSDDWFPR